MGSCLIIYNVNLNLICHIFRRFTEHRLNLCSYFFNIPVCYTLLSDNVRGISAIKTVSGDMTSFFHFCTDLLPRGNTHSVGVKITYDRKYHCRTRILQSSDRAFGTRNLTLQNFRLTHREKWFWSYSTPLRHHTWLSKARVV